MSKHSKGLQHVAAAGLLWLMTAPVVQAADFLMIPDSNSDRILLFDPTDGALVNDNFIDGAGVFLTPINAVQVKNEIWVSDQVADSIFRFDLTGGLIDTITGGLDNIRGMEVVGDLVYVSNARSGNGAPGDGEVVVQFDLDGNNVGFFDTGDPFDIFTYQGELLVNDINSDSDGGEDIDRYAADGTLLGTFHESDGLTGINFPQQMTQRSNGNLLIAGFSTPGGVYEYDPNGNFVAVYDADDGFADNGIRGVYELANGNILWTRNGGVLSTDLTTGISTDIFTVNTPALLPEGGYVPSSRFIEPLTLPTTGESVPEPSMLLGLLSMGLLSRQRRRV